MLTVLSIFGTRPEAIKMAPVVKELARQCRQPTPGGDRAPRGTSPCTDDVVRWCALARGQAARYYGDAEDAELWLF